MGDSTKILAIASAFMLFIKCHQITATVQTLPDLRSIVGAGSQYHLLSQVTYTNQSQQANKQKSHLVEEWVDFKGNQARIDVSGGNQDSSYLFLPNSKVYNYYPYKCQLVDGIQQLAKSSLYPGFQADFFKDNFGVGQLWMRLSSLSNLTLVREREGPDSSEVADSVWFVSQHWQAEDENYIYQMLFGGDAMVLEELVITNRTDNRTVVSIFIADFSWIDNDDSDQTQRLFDIPAGYGCPMPNSPLSSIENTVYSFQRILSESMVSVNFELDVYKMDASTKQLSPISEIRTITSLYGTGLVKHMDNVIDEISVSYDVYRRMNGDVEKMVSTKTVLDHVSQIKYTIDMSLGLCERERIRQNTTGDIHQIDMGKDIDVKLDRQTLGVLFGDDGFVMTNKYLTSDHVEIVEFEKNLDRIVFGGVIGQAAIVRRYEHNKSFVQLKKFTSRQSVASLKMTIFNTNKDGIQTMFVAKDVNVEAISSERFLSAASVENCYKNGEGQWGKLSLRYIVEPKLLGNIESMKTFIEEQVRVALMSKLNISPLQLSSVALAMEEDGFLLDLTLLDRPRAIDFGRLRSAHRLTDTLSSRGESLFGVDSVESCSKWCTYYDCNYLTYCANDNYCLLLPSASVYANEGHDKVYDTDSNCFSYEIDKDSAANVKRLQPIENLCATICDEATSYSSVGPNISTVDQSLLEIGIFDSSHNIHLLQPIGCDDEQEDSINQVVDHGRQLDRLNVHFSELMHGHKLSESDKGALIEIAPSSYDECEFACLESQCLLFSYCSGQRSKCLVRVNELQLKRLDDIGSLVEEAARCNIVQHDPLSLFSKHYEIDEPSDYDRLVLANDEIECAQSCIGYLDGTSQDTDRQHQRCHSFDLCWSGQASRQEDDSNSLNCYIHYRARLGNPKKLGIDDGGQLAKDRVECTRYDRAILADFQMFQHKSFNMELEELASRVLVIDMESGSHCIEACHHDSSTKGCTAFASCYDALIKTSSCLIYTGDLSGFRATPWTKWLIDSDKCSVHVLPNGMASAIHNGSIVYESFNGIDGTKDDGGIVLSWFIGINILSTVAGIGTMSLVACIRGTIRLRLTAWIGRSQEG